MPQLENARNGGAALSHPDILCPVHQDNIRLGTDLPVWTGLTCTPNKNGNTCLRNGDSLAEALSQNAARNIPVINIMHTGINDVDSGLDALNRHWSGYAGVHARTGNARNHRWMFDGTISPQDYALAAKYQLDRCVQIICGCCGCCGIRTNHIAALSRIV